MGFEHWLSVGFAVGVPVWLAVEELLMRIESADEAPAREVGAPASAQPDRRTA
jgi:hypothetical protein